MNEEATSEQLMQIQFGYTMIISSPVLAQSILKTKVYGFFILTSHPWARENIQLYLRRLEDYNMIGQRKTVSISQKPINTI